MDPTATLEELKRVSAQFEAALIFQDGEAVASTIRDDERSARIAKAAAELLDSVPGDAVQVQAVLRDGCVFVVREGGRAIVATTGPEPPIGLVMYDLRACLRSTAGSASAAA